MDAISGAVSTTGPGREAAPALAAGQLMLTVEDVAKVLICSPRSVHRLVDAGRIPKPCSLGRLTRWPRQRLEEWIAAGCPECRRK